MEIVISDRASVALRESYDIYFTAMTEYSGNLAMDFSDFTETILFVGMTCYETHIAELEKETQRKK